MIRKLKRCVFPLFLIFALALAFLIMIKLQLGLVSCNEGNRLPGETFHGTSGISRAVFNPNKYSKLELHPDPIYNVNCTAMIKRDFNGTLQGQFLQSSNQSKISSDSYYVSSLQQCQTFIRTRKYITFSLSREEEEFPIAYSMVIHQRSDHFERLLRAIYAPQNIYCVHIDNKSSHDFKAAVRSVAACFPNVFVARKQENVVYASWARVQADLNCMEELLARHRSWKYFINLCGMDFPIKTNLEIVQQLKLLRGQNSLETEQAPKAKRVRWKFHFNIINGKLKKSNVTKNLLTGVTNIFSGNAYIVVSRRFVEHVFKDPEVQVLREWAKDTYSPDEFLWATLQRLPGVPGSMPRHRKYDTNDMKSVARLVKWKYFEGDLARGKAYPLCAGIHRRAVCIYGAGDLNWMLQQPHFFANKFDTNVDAMVLECLDHYLRHRALAASGFSYAC
ncbi:beta-1,3-galactosyl-O-glycosyl-glycoprotein beta-1,6-N-acetylglucosaminyltransferase [Callorhinchus milii]|uniref:Beta-1,3-galactosyl-O-glycosyl-glycoprotein beta-1,6-N-acetylglucosaminyltransferase-like n=1 Tax=Callorhinchus milii TaxID=7868 RepID=A0A4W3H1C2_CALMI|nr:beta-1,3-galactosyl-O-glycosyl-glycoprotein beta-1,6-N-acetylglucosaminyltransferase [Callorhinchus milii]XP_007906167.1 beta-1,3-galactosyl-O-glycosyl-glycoprotein beta-1,6-N-acetylglucosaminyltransferase [Callorhinchus milii]XP_007906168.1 beta-1,3-galactosyl-O-glycosyl-glycoprotein beta-1,6-N-acetylglucosaminyltransferase [Callorhinchus milii]|eukprot:gi/632978893/ref/XP_007906166.1/ PREDICTED: beta-1,3-galactosyl-O-glycosyl-glycoprotein beta-1,6-N-acetylglucosaminyltransferase-like [Callorhinchus milii]